MASPSRTSAIAGVRCVCRLNPRKGRTMSSDTDFPGRGPGMKFPRSSHRARVALFAAVSCSIHDHEQARAYNRIKRCERCNRRVACCTRVSSLLWLVLNSWNIAFRTTCVRVCEPLVHAQGKVSALYTLVGFFDASIDVTEGYRTTPTFMRAQTTNAIFCSANDTLREIYANQPVASSSDAERKRSRSITALDTPPESVSRDEVQQETPLCDDKAARPVKPLKRPMRSAKLAHTQSLPASMFTSQTLFAPSHGQVDEEPDWSEEAFNPVPVSDKGFEPMTLDP